MSPHHLYTIATRTAILGTHRQQLPAELEEALPALGIREDAPPAEQLLEAISILDRLKRTRLPAPISSDQFSSPPEAETQAGKTLDPRGVRALELVLGDSYRQALPEVLEWIEEFGWAIPAHVIADVLTLSLAAQKAGVFSFSERLLQLTGNRGKWLAAQHPDWQDLLPPEDWDKTYAKLSMPSQKAALLRRWRKVDATTAREALEKEWSTLKPKQQEIILPALITGLNPADVPFLQVALKPRRKDVRKLAAQLLLMVPDQDTYAELKALAQSWTTLDGQRLIFSTKKEEINLLDDFGFSDPKRSPENNLLAHLPPKIWSEITKKSAVEFVQILATANPAAIKALLKAVIFYDSPEWRTALLKYYIYQDRPQTDLSKLTLELYEQITAAEYRRLVEWSLKNVEQVFRSGGVLRTISLQLPYSWPDQLAKMMLGEFTQQFSYGRRAYGYGLTGNKAWKTLPYRMDVSLFPWLKRELYAATERDDQYGNIATKMLQVVSFRKTVREVLRYS